MASSGDEDRAAILSAIEEMTVAYFAKDFDRWAACWVQAPYTRRWSWFSNGGVTIREGWEQQSLLMKRSMERHPAKNRSAGHIRRDNITIRIDRDMAWVTFDQLGPKTGDPFDVPGLQKEMRILERHEGKWKVAFHCVFQRSFDPVASAVVQVDAGAAVISVSPAAAEALRHHPSLVIRAGCLHAADRAADQRLKAAIRWAASLDDGLAMPDSRLPFAVQRGALPIVLSGGGGEPTNVCWVVADSGMVLVSIGDRRTTQDQLAAAAIVYGITPAQTRLAGLIIAGHDIVDAAGQLGVSVTTARTHLQRMYDKTGVRSQPALVRALLSVASPPS